MKIAITGGTGLVGKQLTELLQFYEHDIIILTRGDSKVENGIRYIQWLNEANPETELEGIDAFINLAGVSLNDGRWTNERKKAIFESRMDATEEVVRIISTLEKKPRVLINASAVGIYPTSTTTIYTEKSTEVARDFLGTTVVNWEERAREAEEFGVRVCLTRFGVILGQEGALPLMMLPYQLGVGGTVGSGEQWLSWIHVEDVARAIVFALEKETLSGPINCTSPNTKRMRHFGKVIGQALNRPHWLPVPSLMMKLAMGERSQLVLEGQYVVPEKLLQAGFEFKFVSLEEAITDLHNN